MNQKQYFGIVGILAVILLQLHPDRLTEIFGVLLLACVVLGMLCEYILDFGRWMGWSKDEEDDDEEYSTDYEIYRGNVFCKCGLHQWKDYAAIELGSYQVCFRCGEQRGTWKGKELTGFNKEWWSSVGEPGDTVTVYYEDGTKELLRDEDRC